LSLLLSASLVLLFLFTLITFSNSTRKPSSLLSRTLGKSTGDSERGVHFRNGNGEEPLARSAPEKVSERSDRSEKRAENSEKPEKAPEKQDGEKNSESRLKVSNSERKKQWAIADKEKLPVREKSPREQEKDKLGEMPSFENKENSRSDANRGLDFVPSMRGEE
jgi:hypothetical protein